MDLLILIVIIFIVYLLFITPSETEEHMQSGGSDGTDGPDASSKPSHGSVPSVDGGLCQLPSVNNPFMNAINGDPRGRAVACTGDKVKELSNDYFKLGLYNDINDIWDRNDAQREYVTMPSTTYPNDRDKWAKWLFTTMGSCRDGDMDYCLQYDSILYP